jgi:alpha-beta hydrolase superfamily lysophospholipase
MPQGPAECASPHRWWRAALGCIVLLFGSGVAAWTASPQAAMDSALQTGPAGTMRETAISSDGTKLSYIRWPASPTGYSPTSVIVLHGIGYHAEPYKVVADGLNRDGIDVYAVDARGHGRSAGERGYVPAPLQVRSDIDAVISAIKSKAPDTRIFLIGDSMGSAFALAYLTGAPSRVSGAVLLALPLNIRKSQLFRSTTPKILVQGLMQPDAGVVSLVDSRLEESSRSKEFVAQRRNDPLAYKSVSAHYLLGIHRLTRGWESSARKITLPLLAMQGSEDPIAELSSTKRFFALAGSSDKELVILQGVPHTLLWDPETPRILEKIGSWLKQRSGQSTTLR